MVVETAVVEVEVEKDQQMYTDRHGEDSLPKAGAGAGAGARAEAGFGLAA